MPYPAHWTGEQGKILALCPIYADNQYIEAQQMEYKYEGITIAGI